MADDSVGALLRAYREKTKATKKPKPSRNEFCLHNGYKFDDDAKEQLSEIIANYSNCAIMDEIIIAVNYHRAVDQPSMRAWYHKSKKKSGIAYLRGIFVVKRCVVGHFTINATHYYINLVNDTRMRPQELKVRAINGSLGEEMVLSERIQFSVSAYQTCIPHSERRKPRKPFYCQCLSN